MQDLSYKEKHWHESCFLCYKVLQIWTKHTMIVPDDRNYLRFRFVMSKLPHKSYTQCRGSLVDKQFGSKADRIYCGPCYDAQFASRCDACGDVFKVRLLGTCWYLLRQGGDADDDGFDDDDGDGDDHLPRQGWRRWSTRAGSGTRNVSSAVLARNPSAPRASFQRCQMQ